MAGHHPAALLPHGGPRESGRNIARDAGEAHRRGVEPRRFRFGVEAVHQHARCKCGRILTLRFFVGGRTQRHGPRIRSSEQAAGLEPAQADPDNHQLSARTRARWRRRKCVCTQSAVLPARRHLFDAKDRTCTDHSPRGSSPTTGNAKEERPPGCGRENRTLAHAGMSRDGAQHGPQNCRPT